MKKLPIGIQTFSKIIENNYLYIDKTDIAYNLINNNEYYFLSRPRRFGKSLFLDTLKSIFEGKKELFEGLYIYDKWDFDITYPVIKISFGAGVNPDAQKLDKSIINILKYNQRRLGIECEDINDARDCFRELIETLYDKFNQKVVILIDEYDKPILDNITDSKLAKEMRDRLKNFYSVIKDSDEFIKFVFITGVSKFSKMTLFSGLNNLEDITLDKRYATICGYTHDDIKTSFKDHLKGVDLELLKSWYNGYYYLGDKVYNPFDILLFIAKGAEDYRNYWWSTGNPSFLIEILQKRDYFIPNIENFEATDALLDSFDVDNIDLIALLWQTGYLTIKKKISDEFGVMYTLAVPNREIQISLNSLIIDYLTTQRGAKIAYRKNIYYTLRDADLDEFEKILKSLFASIPYNNFTNNEIQNYEGYYASVIYAYLASLGVEIITEDATNKSRIDLTLKFSDKVYIFEFKVTDKPDGKALNQIKDRGYHQKYQNFENIYLVGIEFCKEDRNICSFDWEKVQSI